MLRNTSENYSAAVPNDVVSSATDSAVSPAPHLGRLMVTRGNDTTSYLVLDSAEEKLIKLLAVDELWRNPSTGWLPRGIKEMRAAINNPYGSLTLLTELKRIAGESFTRNPEIKTSKWAFWNKSPNLTVEHKKFKREFYQQLMGAKTWDEVDAISHRILTQHPWAVDKAGLRKFNYSGPGAS